MPRTCFAGMSDGFVPLAALLRPPPEPALDCGPPMADERPAQLTTPDELAIEYALTLGAVRRFRAAVFDALDVSVRQLLEEIAENVLARELRLAGADVASIVAKARERFSNERILAVRVHPSDRDALGELAVERIIDDTLAPGDVIAELRSGTIDMRLRTRIEHALSEVTPC
jgi:hypothetical protein